MEATIEIKEERIERDYFPCLFADKSRNVVILADARTSERTFSGMVIYADKNAEKKAIGKYSTGWTYASYERLPKGSMVQINLLQENGK